MALRSLDNALPIKHERPKKALKVAAIQTEILHESCLNNENTPPLQPKTSDLIEYVASEDLKALSVPETKIKSLMEELESKDWTKVCEALNDVRRFTLHHSDLLLPTLENVMLVVVKALKNPRSALCKTAIMASTDIFHSFGHVLLADANDAKAFDHLLLQLLLKASQDKKFVCEEAHKSLDAMATFTSPLPLLKKLQSYVHHTNLRVRAKAAVAISKCLSNMDVEIMKEFGLATLLQIAAEMLNDRLPEAREAARCIINATYGGFSREDGSKCKGEGIDGEKSSGSWQDFCSSNLPPISAQSIAKVVSQVWDVEIMKEFGLATLLQIAAEMLNDRLPEAREAARCIINATYGGFSREDGSKCKGEGIDGEKSSGSWQDFCSSNLPPISAQSIAKVVSQ